MVSTRRQAQAAGESPQVLTEHSLTRLAGVNRRGQGGGRGRGGRGGAGGGPASHRNLSNTPIEAPHPPSASTPPPAIAQPNPSTAPPETPQLPVPEGLNTASTTDQPNPNTATPGAIQPPTNPNPENAAGNSSSETGGKRKNSDDGNPDSGKRAKTGEEQTVDTIDPCQAYRDRISQLVPTIRGSLTILERFGRDTGSLLLQAIAAVTETIAELGGPSFSLLSQITPSPVGQSILARPAQEVLIPVVQGLSHYALVIVRRNENSDGFYYEFYNSSPSRRNDQEWMDQKVSDTSQSLRDLGWALLTNVPNTHRLSLVQINHDPSWRAQGENEQGENEPLRVRENEDDSWVSGLHVVLSGWIYALGLQPLQWPEGNTRGGFYHDALQLVALARDGVIGADTIRDFLACHDLIDRASQVPEDRRFANTHAFRGGHDLYGRIQQVRRSEVDERARQQQEEAERQEREQRERLRQQELLRQHQRAAWNPCQEFAQGLDRWRNQQQDSAAEFTPLVVGGQVTQDDAFQAIASVTEAINRAADPGSQLFSLVDNGLTLTLHNQTVARPRHEVLYAVPSEGGGHLTLYVVRVNREGPSTEFQSGGTGSSFRVQCHDSSPGTRVSARNPALFREARQVLEDGGWTGQNTGARRNAADTSLLAGNIELAQNVADQSTGWSCGYHTILNAWAYALSLQTARTNAPSARTAQFGNHIVEMVNLALQGLMDAATIEAFFACYGFIAPNQHIPLTRRFDNTVAFRRIQDLQYEVARVRLTDEMRQRSIEDATTPTFEDAFTAIVGATLLQPLDLMDITADTFLEAYNLALTMQLDADAALQQAITDSLARSQGATETTQPNTQSTNPNTQSTNANTPSPQRSAGHGPSSGPSAPSGALGTSAPLPQSVIDDIAAAEQLQGHYDRYSNSGDDNPNAEQTSPTSPPPSEPSNDNGSVDQTSPTSPVPSVPSGSGRDDTGIQHASASPASPAQSPPSGAVGGPIYPPPGNPTMTQSQPAAPINSTAPAPLARPAWMAPGLSREENIRSLQEQVDRLRNAPRLNTVAVPRTGEHAGQGPERFIATMTRLRQEGYVPGTEEFAAREGNVRVERERQERERRADEERRLASVGERPENNNTSNPQPEAFAPPHQVDHIEDDTDSLFGEPRGDHGMQDEALEDDDVANDLGVTRST